MPDIFINYARTDKAFAGRLGASLVEVGASVYIDTGDTHDSVKHSHDVQMALDTSRVMLVIITPNSMSSEAVEADLNYFRDKNKPIIPIWLEPAKMHYRLSRIQYIDFHTLDYKAAFMRLRLKLRDIGLHLDDSDMQDIVTLTASQKSASLNTVPKTPDKKTGMSIWPIVAGVLLLVVVVGIGAFALSSANIGPTSTPTLDSQFLTAEAQQIASLTAIFELDQMATYEVATHNAAQTATASVPTVTHTPRPTATVTHTPTETATPTVTPTIDPTVRVRALQDTNVREQPNVRADRLDFFLQGQIAEVIRTDDSGWYYIQSPNGFFGYVAPSVVEIVDNSTLPTSTPSEN